MGYDFMLEKAKDLSQVSFPCEYGSFEMEVSTFPWEILQNHLIQNGARENPDSDSLIWNLGEKGHIYINGTDSYVSLDIHAEWSIILELFIWLKNKDSNVVLADINEGVYYDPESFRSLMTTG